MRQPWTGPSRHQGLRPPSADVATSTRVLRARHRLPGDVSSTVPEDFQLPPFKFLAPARRAELPLDRSHPSVVLQTSCSTNPRSTSRVAPTGRDMSPGHDGSRPGMNGEPNAEARCEQSVRRCVPSPHTHPTAQLRSSARAGRVARPGRTSSRLAVSSQLLASRLSHRRQLAYPRPWDRAAHHALCTAPCFGPPSSGCEGR